MNPIVESLREQLRKAREERDAANALIVLLRSVVSASLHGTAQEKANAYAALNRYDKAARERAHTEAK